MRSREALFPNLFPTVGNCPAVPKPAQTAPWEITTTFTNAAPLARKSDPATSKAAAEQLTKSGKRDSSKAVILAWIGSRLYPTHGYTSAEIAKYACMEHPTVHKRLPDLRRDGKVVNGAARKCSVTGRQSLTWKLA